MESSPAFPAFSQIIREVVDKFYVLIENDESLFNQERLEKFLRVAGLDFDEDREVVAQSILNKTFHEKMMKERGLKQAFKFWERLRQSSTTKQTSSKISVTVGSETPEIQKNHLNVELISDTKKQIALLNQHLSSINPDVEVPFVALKLYTATPNESKEFLDGMIQMFSPMLEGLNLPIVPEFSVVAGSDNIILRVTATKSIEISFGMFVIGHMIASLPEYDVELRYNMKLGTNFRHLIQNHTDNTVFDLFNGFSVNVEFTNNLSGFVDQLVNKAVEKGHKSDILQLRLASILLGSVSLNSDLKLNLGANELALMANLPKVNIFDTQGILASAPLGQVKAMREDDMGQMILPNLTNLEGRAEIFFSTPMLTVHVNVDVSGVLDLANSTIDLHSA